MDVVILIRDHNAAAAAAAVGSTATINELRTTGALVKFKLLTDGITLKPIKLILLIVSVGLEIACLWLRLSNKLFVSTNAPCNAFN